MKKITYKRWQILLTFLSLFILASSFYFQYIKGLQPCPLCLMQRLCVFLLFLTCFMGVYVKSLRGGKWLTVFQMFFAVGGLFFASRQLWLQSLPIGQTPACLPDFSVLMRYFPWSDVLHAFLWGTGDCAEVSWQWLGLSMPAWAALYFLFMFIAAVFIFWNLRNYLLHVEA